MYFLKDVIVLKNNNGIVLGVILKKDGKFIIVLFGFLREMKVMFNESVKFYL